MSESQHTYGTSGYPGTSYPAEQVTVPQKSTVALWQGSAGGRRASGEGEEDMNVQFPYNWGFTKRHSDIIPNL